MQPGPGRRKGVRSGRDLSGAGNSAQPPLGRRSVTKGVKTTKRPTAGGGARAPRGETLHTGWVVRGCPLSVAQVVALPLRALRGLRGFARWIYAGGLAQWPQAGWSPAVRTRWKQHDRVLRHGIRQRSGRRPSLAPLVCASRWPYSTADGVAWPRPSPFRHEAPHSGPWPMPPEEWSGSATAGLAAARTRTRRGRRSRAMGAPAAEVVMALAIGVPSVTVLSDVHHNREKPTSWRHRLNE